MKKRDFNLVGNEGTDNQELAKGIAFVKSRRAELNVVQMVESMRDQAIPNGVIINDAYCDRSMTRDYLMSCMRILGKTHMAFRAESDQE